MFCPQKACPTRTASPHAAPLPAFWCQWLFVPLGSGPQLGCVAPRSACVPARAGPCASPHAHGAEEGTAVAGCRGCACGNPEDKNCSPQPSPGRRGAAPGPPHEATTDTAPKGCPNAFGHPQPMHLLAHHCSWGMAHGCRPQLHSHAQHKGPFPRCVPRPLPSQPQQVCTCT